MYINTYIDYQKIKIQFLPRSLKKNTVTKYLIIDYMTFYVHKNTPSLGGRTLIGVNVCLYLRF